MSEVGSQSGLYEELHECAELIDAVLLDLKAEGGRGASQVCRALGTMLASLKGNNWPESPARLLVLLLSLFTRGERAEWAAAGEALLNDRADQKTVTMLERLAESLEQEQQHVMARIQGL